MERLEHNVVHEICTNQVVVTLQACVKELVENSLDAGATRIEVRLRESGSELLEVVDNGCGVAAADHASLAIRHATSKIREYDDLSSSLSTFGFRGEALAGICAMGDLTICTRTSTDASAVLLVYDRFGKLTSTTPAAREVGTTVSVRDLFRRLPVRHREFLRNAKVQVSTALKHIQAYAIARPDVRFHVVAERVRGHGAGRTTLLSTSGTTGGWLQAAASVLGDAAVADTRPLDYVNHELGWSISGVISTPSGGRRSRDIQLFFVNRRPIDPPKRIGKLINDTYHQYNSRMWPVVILSFTGAQQLVDVNVTPDKRTVFLHNEEALLEGLHERLTDLFAPTGATPAATLANFGIRGVAIAARGAESDSETPESRRAGASLDAGGGAGESQVTFETPEKSSPQCGFEATAANGPPSSAPPPFEAFMPGSPWPAFEPPTSAAPSGPSSAAMMAADEKRLGVLAAGTSRGQSSAIDLDETELPPKQRRLDQGGASLDHFDAFALGGAAPASGSTLTVASPLASEAFALDGSSAAWVGAQTSSLAAVSRALAPETPLGSDAPPAEFPAVYEAAMDGVGIVQSEAPAATFALAPEVGAVAPVRSVVRAAADLASISAAVARRRAAARAGADGGPRAGVSARGYFPSSFSLSSLKDDQIGGASVKEVVDFGKDQGDVAPDRFRFSQSSFSQMRVIGQFNLGFIIAALPMRSASGGEDGGLQIFIIDQHASDEKFRFEGFNRESKIDRQPLMAPHPLQLTPAQESIAEAHLDVLRLNGFDVTCDDSKPPGRRLRLTSLPTCQGMVFSERDIHDLIHVLEDAEVSRGASAAASVASQVATSGSAASASRGLLNMAGHRSLLSIGAVPRPQKVWQLLACRACRGAIMIGKALRTAEMEKILINLGGLQQPWNCPHGRPTMRHLVDASVARRCRPCEGLLLAASRFRVA